MVQCPDSIQRCDVDPAVEGAKANKQRWTDIRMCKRLSLGYENCDKV